VGNINELVFLEPDKIDSAPFTTSEIVAEKAGITHHAVQSMISKHEESLKLFGRVAFEMRPTETKGGIQEMKIYHLNEEQATLLITFLKNTEPVIKFKVELVKAFFLMKTELLNRRSERLRLKPIRREMTDVIKEVDARVWAYKKYTDLAYKLATGKIAKQLRAERGAAKTATVADYMTADEIHRVSELQYKIGVLLEAGLDYERIKTALANRITLAKAG
jgi:phage regulator Rha-like protein